MKKSVLTAISALFLLSNLSAFDIVFRASPGVFIPSDGKIDLDTGLSATAQLDADLFGFLTAGLEGIFDYSPHKNISEDAYIYGGGLGLGGYYFPISRLYLGAGGATGIYQITTTAQQEDSATSGIYARGYGETGFRLTPEFTLGAGVSYSKFFLKKSSESALSVYLGARYTISVGKSGSSSLLVTLDQDRNAFPVFMKAYRNNPIGTLQIRNNEGAEIKNVHVSFRAGKYTSSTYESAVIPIISKHSTKEIPLYADFSKDVLGFVENKVFSGEVIIDYELLGKKKHSIQSALIQFYNSNAFLWLDQMSLSTFISPDTPDIQEFAKYVAGIARNSFQTGINRNLQIAAAMTEALRLCGISYSIEKRTPYTTFHLSQDIDEIQYPIQTLNMSGGDYDDIGILLASCLESVGVPTGYLPLEDDFIVLVSTGLKPTSADTNFASPDSLLIDDESVYFGLSMANLDKGFSKSRKIASQKIKSAIENESASLEYTDVESAWLIYEPCVFNENGAHYEKPASQKITDRLLAAIQDYIDSDLTQALKNAQKTGDHNKIGIVYVRMGRYADAKAEFQKSDSIKAMNNLANVHVFEKNYSKAISIWEKVLKKDPENSTAKRGIETARDRL